MRASETPLSGHLSRIVRWTLVTGALVLGPTPEAGAARSPADGPTIKGIACQGMVNLFL